MKQKTVFTHRDAIIIAGIFAFILLAASIEKIAEALAAFITQ